MSGRSSVGVWVALSVAVVLLLAALALVSVATGLWSTHDKTGGSLLTLGITLVALGIVFATDRLIGYPLIGVGVLLSVVSLYRRRRKAG